MDSTAPPLVGFNNNVRYRGMRFHIQTEDSGVSRPHIITHLFADGGHVIKSIRTDYSEYVEHPDRPALIHRLMREQHRAMALELRDGHLDMTIDRLTPSQAPLAGVDRISASDASTKPHATSTSDASTETHATATSDASAEPHATSACDVSTGPPGTPSTRQVAHEPSDNAEAPPSEGDVPTSTLRSRFPPERAPERKRPSPLPQRAQRSAPKARKAGRPSPALPAKPSGESIFGAAPQECLDDVISSYLSQAKDGPPPRGSK